ncbi:MAG: hypothetical protein ACT6FE_08020 [Methanosarcinaceae archaeon]
MKKSEILSLFDVWGGDSDWNQNLLDSMEVAAKEDPKEFKVLIELFNKQDETRCPVMKNLLAEVLRNLNYEPIKDYYLGIIANHPDLSEKAFATIDLVRMDDQRGVAEFKKIILNLEDSIECEIAEELVTIDSIMSLKLFLYLANREPELAYDYWQRDQVEKRLRKLLEKP